MADDRTVTDDERDDDDDLTPAGILRRLGKVNKILARANARLDRITLGFTAPPEGDKPAFVAALTTTQTSSQLGVDSAIALLTRCR